MIKWIYIGSGLVLLALLFAFRFAGDNYPDTEPPGASGSRDYPEILYVEDSLKVNREGTFVNLKQGDVLLPGDELETCSDQFAVISFSETSLMIVQPVSNIRFAKDGDYIRLVNANILVESSTDSPGFPELISCYDTGFAVPADSDSVSFGIQCRGESGISVTSNKGGLLVTSDKKKYHMDEGMALYGRTLHSSTMEVPFPSRPGIDIADDAEAVYDMPEELQNTASISWVPEPSADQYLVHVFRSDDEPYHRFRYIKNNRFTFTPSHEGSYHIRVLVVDYYGITGDWSVPVSFEFGN